MSKPIPLSPIGPILTIAILLLAAIARVAEVEDSVPAGAAPLPPDTKDLPQ